MEFLPHILLIGLILITAISVLKDKSDYKNFLKVDDTKERQKLFKKWVYISFFLYGLSSIIILFLIDKGHYLYQFPEFYQDIIAAMNSEESDSDGILTSFFDGMSASIPIILICVPILTLVLTYLHYKNPKEKTATEVSDVRNINALFPRNSKEIFWTSMLSINAGFSEELFFRLMAPTLIYMVSGSVTMAIVFSTIWFGLVHYYQGIVGILVTAFVGLVLYGIFLGTQSIWVAVIAHAILDLKDLSFAPLLKQWLNKNKPLTS